MTTTSRYFNTANQRSRKGGGNKRRDADRQTDSNSADCPAIASIHPMGSILSPPMRPTAYPRNATNQEHAKLGRCAVSPAPTFVITGMAPARKMVHVHACVSQRIWLNALCGQRIAGFAFEKSVLSPPAICFPDCVQHAAGLRGGVMANARNRAWVTKSSAGLPSPCVRGRSRRIRRDSRCPDGCFFHARRSGRAPAPGGRGRVPDRGCGSPLPA